MVGRAEPPSTRHVRMNHRDDGAHLGLSGEVEESTLIAQLLGTGSIWELNVIGFILAVIAAVLLIGVAEGLVGKNKVRS
jgi:hypothetical protein